MADLGYSLGRAAGSDIPLEHFDAKYIKTCRNSTELEEILRILRSGIEGSYPHLEEVVERTLSKLKPDSKVLLKEETAVSSSGVQGSEVNEFLDNLELWRGSLSAEDNQQSLSNGGTTHEASFPPVRAVNVAINRASQPARNNEFLTLGRQFLCVNESELAGKVDKEKQKGNEAFRSGDYLEAVDYYSASLDVKPTLQVYTNRALAYLKIKKFKEALSDCMEALKISPSDTKGLFRKACAHEGLGDLTEAKGCLKSVLVAEPANKKASEMLQTVERKIAQQKKQKQKKGKKVVIKEVDEFDKKEKKHTSSSVSEVDQSKDTPPKENQSKDAPHKADQPRDTPPKEDQFKDTPPKADHPRDTPPKEGQPRDTPPKEDQARDTPPKENQARDTPPKEDQARDTPPKADHPRNTPSKVDQPRDTPPKEDQARDTPPKEDQARDTPPKEDQARDTPPKEDQARDTPPKEDQPRDTARTEHPNDKTPMSWPVPEEVDDLKKKGNALYRQGQYSEAVEEYTSALRMLNPDVRPHSSVYSSVLANRAAAWLKLGNCEECIKDSSESIRLRPDFVRAYVRRAEAYEVSEKYLDAVKDYESVLQMVPEMDQIRNAASRVKATLTSLHGTNWRASTSSKSPEMSGPEPPEMSGPEPPETSGPRPPETSGPEPPETSGPEPPEMCGPKPPEMSGPEPPEMSGPKPPEMSGPEPPEMSGPKPPEMSGPEPPEMSGPKPPEMSGPEPPETSGPEPRETPDPKTRKVMKTPEEIFEEFRMKGYSLVQAGDFERALHCYSQCIKSCPSRVTGYTNRALCFLKLNRPGLAEEDCIKALEMDKKNVKGLYRRALARKALKRYSEAAKDLHQLLQIDSNNTAAKAEIDVVKDLWRKDLKNPVSTKNGESSSSRKTSKRKNKAKKKKISIEEVCSEVPKVLLEGDNSKRIVGDGGRQGPRAGTREGPSDDEFAPNTVKGSLPRFDAWHPQTLSTSSEKSVPTISEEKITEAPTTDGPSTKGPTTEAPTTDGPTTDGPTTEGPTNKGPSTKGPSTKGPSTEGPTTEGPTTKGPSTEGPTTEGPTTEALTTEGPSTTEKVTGGLPDEVVAVGRTSVGSGSSPNIGSVLRPNQPVSPYMFLHAWNSIPRSSPPSLYAQILQNIKPQQIPEIISNALDGDMLLGIISAAGELMIKDEADIAYDILWFTSKCKRFTTVAMFLSKQDKTVCEGIIDRLEKTRKTEEINHLKLVYRIN